MAASLSKHQYGSLVELLKSLRSDLEKYPPISFVEFYGFAAHEDGAATALAAGVCDLGNRFFHYYNSDPPSTTILFGPDECTKTLRRLTAIAPYLSDVVLTFCPPEHKTEISRMKELDEERRGVMVASLVRLAVERAREYEPESLVLPNIVRGKLFCTENVGHFCFPNGRISHADVTRWEQWSAVRSAVAQNSVSMIWLQVPVIQAAAIIVKFAIDSSEISANMADTKKIIRRKRRGDEHRADWYTDKIGIPVARLDAARRNGRLYGEKRGGRWFYSLRDVQELWPDDFDE